MKENKYGLETLDKVQRLAAQFGHIVKILLFLIGITKL